MSARFVATGAPQPLAAQSEIALLRAAQEGMANIRKHAQASEVVLTLSYWDNRVILDVRDNGRGFDVSAAAGKRAEIRGGLGLRGLKARLAVLGGGLEVESAPGDGTVLVAQVPIGADGPATEGFARQSRGRWQEVNRPIRIMVVDDHPVVRTGVQGMLASNTDFDLVGEASDGEEASARSRRLTPMSC